MNKEVMEDIYVDTKRIDKLEEAMNNVNYLNKMLVKEVMVLKNVLNFEERVKMKKFKNNEKKK